MESMSTLPQPTLGETAADVTPIEAVDVLLAELRAEIAKWDAYWGALTQGGGGAAPAMDEAGQVVNFLRSYLAPRIDQVSQGAPEERLTSLKLMVPFDTAGGLRDFLLHFFQVAPRADSDTLVFEERDSFERDVFLLYDLYRVKKALEVVSILQAARQDPAQRFPSMLDEATIGSVLASLSDVLGVLYSQCLPEETVRTLVPQLSPEMLSGAAVLQRRESGLLYTYPQVLQRYQYRNFFFLLFFKNGFKGRIAGQEREFRFNYTRFQILRYEFLLHWLTATLKHDPRKYEQYQNYRLRGKTLLEYLAVAPERELEHLRALPGTVFHELTSRVNDSVPAELRVGPVPHSESFGFYYDLKRQLNQAVEYVRAPIEDLRKLVQSQPPPARPAAAVPAAPPPAQPAAPPATPAAAGAAPPARWGISPLAKDAVPAPFFLQGSGSHRGQHALFKTKLARDYLPFAQFVTALLEATPDAEMVRRYTPRQEWALPFLMRRTLHDAQREYLLILGAEVTAKAKGMRVSAKESYDFAPYFVFCAEKDPEGEFGKPIGEREVAAQKFHEHSFNAPGVVRTVMDMIDGVRSHLGLPPPA
jgi:hypothetical protein